MKDHRQGNDLAVLWSIFKDGEPFDLRGRSLKLYLKNLHERKEVVDFSVTGNEIHWTFYGKDQDTLGKHSLILVANEDEKGMITTDACDFVRLVSCSCKLQGGEDSPNVQTESIVLTSTLEYVAGGGSYDDTAVWKELKKKVDKEEGLGLSEENYTTEEKAKLANLENYDDSGIKDELANKADKSAIPTKMSQLEQDIKLGDESPFGFGEGENSAILKGGNNQVISEGGVALGEDNVVGLKGWYYSSIYKENDNTISIYLSNEQKAFNSDEAFKTESQTADESLPNLVEILGVNAVISLVNAGKYDDKFIVIGGSNGVVKLQTIDKSKLPFNVITGQSVINYEDYSIYCLSKPDAGIAELGKYSFAVGYNNKATNGESAAFGYNNHAYGKFSFVEGKDNKAGYASHAEGRSNIASGSISHAEGCDNVASGYLSHAEGGYNIAEGSESHAEGYYTIARGAHSHAEGTETIAEGLNSHVEGYNTKALGNYSHAEGGGTVATGNYSHAEGYYTKATGNNSHAEGNYTKTEGINSHAEGHKSQALGPQSHAEGNETKAKGSCAHAEGYKSQALGKYSHAEGSNTISQNEAEHACGKYNRSIESTDKAQATHFSIGIGTSDSEKGRKNAVEVKQNGDVYIIGVGGYDGTNAEGATVMTLQDVLSVL